jgi:ectoine hydroxylase-related dioxygenase (phytanoyl-CoA dioxygenase family)
MCGRQERLRQIADQELLMTKLSSEEVQQFKKEGWLVGRNAVSADLLARLNRQLDDWVAESRSKTGNYGETLAGTHRFDLEKGHSAERPRLRRVNNPVEVSEVFREAAFDSAIADMTAEVISPDIRFLHSKINLKLPGTDTRVGFHSDFAYVPHSNEDVVTTLLMLTDLTVENGCLMVVPGSHLEAARSLWRGDVFAGEVAPDVAEECVRRAVPITGRAGSVVLMHANTLHGSTPNRSAQPRGLYIGIYSAADAVPISPNSLPNRDEGRIVRGQPTRTARLRGGPVELPAAFRSTSFFEVQGQQSVYANANH